MVADRTTAATRLARRPRGRRRDPGRLSHRGWGDWSRHGRRALAILGKGSFELREPLNLTHLAQLQIQSRRQLTEFRNVEFSHFLVDRFPELAGSSQEMSDACTDA